VVKFGRGKIRGLFPYSGLMNIKNDLPQFEGRKALIIVSGEFHAIYYLVHNGHISIFDQFAVANPRKGSHEDYVETTKNGISGSVYDGGKQEMQKKLLKRLSKETREICQKERIVDTYLFCIKFMLRETKEALAEEVRKMMRLEYPGDMKQRHPFELLEIIKDEKAIVA
jgi:hypothetical protein